MPPLLRTSAVFLLLAAILGSVCCLLPAAPPNSAPLKIQRVFVSQQKLAEELARLRTGPLVSLPRDDFENLVRRATTTPEPPRLVEAAYEAVLVDGDLVGTARWQIVQANDGLLPLGPFNLALTRLPQRRPAAVPLAVALVGLGRWTLLTAPSVLSTEIPVGDFDGKGSALFLEGPARHSVDLSWKAHGEASPDGWHFDLRWPAAPAATIDLIVPGDTAISAPEKMFLAGPLPLPSGERRNGAAFSPNARRWRLYCGGMEQADLVLRPARPGPNPLPLVHTLTTQTICPDAVEARFEVDVEVLHQSLKELVFDCDPGLEPYDVNGRHIEGWEVIRGTPRRLLVRLREPLRNDRFTIDCLAPLHSKAATGSTMWTSPSLHLVGAVNRGETLLLRLHPDLQMDQWNSGDFRLENAETVQDTEHGSLHQLTLRGGALLADPLPGQAPNQTGAPRRPTALVQAAGTSFGVRQAAWWQVAPGRQTLTLSLTYEVLQGQLSQQVVRLPTGWEVDTVKVGDPGLASRTVRTSLWRNYLIVDLKSPLVPLAQSKARSPDHGTLLVTLRPARETTNIDQAMPFPDAVPIGARYRKGVFAIDAMTGRESVSLRSSLAEGAAEEGPWGSRMPMVSYPFLGEAPRGTLTLRAQVPELRVRCQTDVIVHGQQATMESRLQIEAEAGSPQSVDFSLSANDGGAWQWQAGVGAALAGPPRRRFEAEIAAGLAPLATSSPLGAAALHLLRPSGQMWHLDFARPLQSSESLVLLGSLHANRPGGAWQVPLPFVPGAGRLDGIVNLHLSGPISVNVTGMREEAANPSHARNAARTFRYTLSSVGLTLLLPDQHAERTANAPQPAALTDDACLTTTFGLGPRLHHRFVFHLAGWSAPTLFLGLPPNARPQAVRVDGVWLDHLLTEADGIRLPVPGNSPEGPRDHRYEVIYDTPAPALWAGAALSAPLPSLLPQPLHVRRIWRLPSDIQPLSGDTWVRLPGPGAGRGDDRRKQPADLFRLLGPPPQRLAGPTGDAEQRQALADAALGLRSTRNGKPLPLRDVLTEITNRLMSSKARDRLPLVIDARSLVEAERDSGYSIPLDPVGVDDQELLPWEKDKIGLVTLVGRSATLVTTRQQFENWRREGSGLPNAVDDAVTEAARSGHDASGRYRALWDWPDAALETAVPLAGAWTEWEPAAGQADTLLVVVRTSAVQTAAAGLALLAVLLIWRPAGRAIRTRLALWTLMLGTAGVALWWLPTALQPLAWWPFVATAATALLWHLHLAWSTPAPTRTRKKILEGAGIGVISLCALGVFRGEQGLLAMLVPDAGHADAAPGIAPTIVFVVPSTPGPGETVFAPPELLDQLRSHVVAAIRANAVLLTADYNGKVVGNVASIQVVLRTWNTSAEPTMAALPFDGIALDGDVKVDGARAFPVALPSPQTGLAVPTRGSGWHEIRFVFKVPVLPGTSGDDLELQFGAPRLLINHLRLRLPGQATDIQAIGRQGSQHVQPSNAGPTLDADLGSKAGPVVVRWSLGPQSPRPALVQFREAWLWDLRPEAATLTGWLSFQISQGTTTHLEVQVPGSLVVRRATAPRLREWRVLDEGRDHLLRLEFTGPLTGEIGVALELVPRSPFTASLTLPLPAPRGQALKEGGYLAYRTDGQVEAQRQPTLNLTGLAAKDPFAPFWPKVNRPSHASLDYACVFGSADGKRPILPLHLRLMPALAAVHQDITVTVRAHQAELVAKLDLTSASGELAMVQWNIRPARTRWYQPQRTLTVARVSGADVRRWSQDGDHLVVWLEGGKPSAPVVLTGWLSLTPTADGARLDLPRLTVPGARTTSTIRLISDGAVALEPIDLYQLAPQARNSNPPVPRGSVLGIDLGTLTARPPPPAVREGAPRNVYSASGSDYNASWRVRPSSIPPNVQLATILDVRARQRTFETRIDVHFPRHEERSLTIRARAGDWQEVSLTTARDVRRRELRSVAGERSWELVLPPGVDEVRRVTLTGTMPIDVTGSGWLAPDVSIVEASRAERILVVASAELSVLAPPQGLEALPPARLPAWVGDADRLRRPGTTAWLETAPTGKLLLGLARDRAAGSPARLFLADHRADFAEGRGWLIETTLWLWQDTASELSLTWPGDVKVVGLEIDGTSQPPGQTTARTLWLPLATTKVSSSFLLGDFTPGARQVHLWWRWDDRAAGTSASTKSRPRLEGPRLAGVAPGSVIWTVLVPAGCTISQRNGLAAGPGGVASLALARAAAQLDLIAASKAAAASQADAPLAPDASPFSAAALARLACELRRAEQALALGGDSLSEKGPKGQTLAEWLAALRERLRALKVPADADSVDVQDAPVGLGTPYRGRPEAADSAPSLVLTFHTEGQARAAPGPWIGALAGLTLLAMLPVVWPRLRPLWPEQFGVLAALGWIVAGPTPVVLLLLLAWAMGRAAGIVSLVGSLRQRRTRAVAGLRS